MLPLFMVGSICHYRMLALADFDTEFQEEISVMPSLVKPKRVTIRGSDGSLYSFLCKPKDDLRKDARLMDFFSMINKLLKADSESRRRRLRMHCAIPELCSGLLSNRLTSQIFGRMPCCR